MALFVLGCLATAAACGPTAPTPAATVPPGATQELGSPIVSSAEPTPPRTPVPGFEDWATINAQAVRITVDGDVLSLRLVGSVLWFHAERGVLFHTEVTGDFRATSTVRTARDSDPSSAPGGDGSVQLAGLMVRAEVPVENSVFIVTGSLGASTGIETKTTTSSRSIWTTTARALGGDADLRLCRQGSTIRLAYRPAGSSELWVPVSTFDREDLPATLQVGANIYTDGVPDLIADFEGLAIEPLADGEAC